MTLDLWSCLVVSADMFMRDGLHLSGEFYSINVVEYINVRFEKK